MITNKKLFYFHKNGISCYKLSFKISFDLGGINFTLSDIKNKVVFLVFSVFRDCFPQISCPSNPPHSAYLLLYKRFFFIHYYHYIQLNQKKLFFFFLEYD